MGGGAGGDAGAGWCGWSPEEGPNRKRGLSRGRKLRGGVGSGKASRSRPVGLRAWRRA